jgi:hypothetical protein
MADLAPAPRWFHPSGETLVPADLTLDEVLGTTLSFVPVFIPDEAYELEFGPAGATLRALAPAGLVYGRTTWNALMAAGQVPAGRI